MRLQLNDHIRVTEDGWTLIEAGADPDRSVVVGSNLLAGNGYLGYRGTFPGQTADDYVGLVVAGTYDQVGDGLRELCTVPDPLWVSAATSGVRLEAPAADAAERRLHLDTGEVGGETVHRIGDATVTIRWRRTASLAEVRLLAQRWEITSDTPIDVEVEAGLDGAVWSLNGDHLRNVSFASEGAVSTAAADTAEDASRIVVGVRHDPAPNRASTEGHRHTGAWRLSLQPGEAATVESVAAVATSRDSVDPAAAVTALLDTTGDYRTIAAESAAVWQDVWQRMDVEVGGNPIDQTLLRFAAYHNRICTPAHTDRLPIGARGLSCQAYQGAAFWDQEMYNLEVFLTTEPEIARSVLAYRHHTLDGARRKAARLGYAGAYYPWMSGDTGDELCPDIFFTDVLTGRPIRNHFNDWQMHISPDIVTAIQSYVEVTGDTGFLTEHGAEAIFEVARFLHSFVRYDDRNDTFHCIRLLGPDEWHENVDDNAFTNHQVHAALDYALAVRSFLATDHPDVLQRVDEAIGLEEWEVDAWRRVRDRIVLPSPDPETGLIEQFRGFFGLEDVTPDEVAERLQDPGEYWGWPNGVAVRTQVAKQADVVMLLWRHPDRFDADTIRANYDYYERRCAHGSSLSHSAYGIVAAHLGDLDAAYDHFRATATIDVLARNQAVVGGTFIGGIHTAACAGTWLLAVRGFGGLEPGAERLKVDPRLPEAWTHLEYPVVWRGRRLRVRAEQAKVTLTALDGEVPVEVRGAPATATPEAPVVVELGSG